MIYIFIIIHVIICSIFFIVGFFMRYGFGNRLAVFIYENIPFLTKEEYDEYKVRRFIGETSIKLGCCPFLIACVGIIQPEDFLIAVILGWICFIIIVVGSVTFMDKFNVIKKIKKLRDTKEETRN